MTVLQKTWMGEEERTENEIKQDFGDDWTDFLEIVAYPPRSARRKPQWMGRYSAEDRFIPDPVKELMKEIYIGLQNGSRRLVTMGTRAVLESIMVHKTGDHGKFNLNLDEFQKAGYLSVRQRNTVEAILEAGHATIHRGWAPSDDDVSALLDITESVIEATYLHEPRAKNIERGVPRQRPRPGSEGYATETPNRSPT